MLKIAHLTSVHPPYDVRIFQKECVSLAKAGYAVTLVAPGENLKARDGVDVIAVPPSTNRRQRAWETTGRVYRAAVKLDADLYHFHDPELIPIGLRLKLKGKRVIYDVHEELPQDIMEKDWLPRPFRIGAAGGAYLAEYIAGRMFDGIVASRPALLDRFPATKTALVNNFPRLGELAQPGSRPIRERDPIAAYVGGMNRERGFIELIDALGQVPDTVALEVQIAGLVEPVALVEQAQKLPGWKRIRLLGWQSRTQVADLLNRARFGIVTFLPIPNHLRSYPTKLFEYMSAGLPTLASDIPLWKKIIEEDGVGRVANPKDPAAFAAALGWMMTHPDECERMGRTGTALVHDRYNWDIEAAQLLGLYKRILKN